MKKIITHLNPDLDAVTAAWLIKRFLPGWKEAEIEFAASSASSKKRPEVDQDPDVLWVDIGRGELDHHQSQKFLSAAKLCLGFIKKARQGRQLSPLNERALLELVAVVTQVDNAADLKWPEVNKSRYYFYLHDVVEGLKGIAETDEAVIEFGFRALDAVLLNLKNRIRAEDELKEGVEFKTPWGKAVGIETGNRHVLWVGEVQGYVLVLIKDPESGGVKIYCRPDSKADLTQAYQEVKKLDPQSDWFLHASKKLLLNQASVNPNMRPTKLSLGQMIAVLKE